MFWHQIYITLEVPNWALTLALLVLHTLFSLTCSQKWYPKWILVRWTREKEKGRKKVKLFRVNNYHIRYNSPWKKVYALRWIITASLFYLSFTLKTHWFMVIEISKWQIRIMQNFFALYPLIFSVYFLALFLCVCVCVNVKHKCKLLCENE